MNPLAVIWVVLLAVVTIALYPAHPLGWVLALAVVGGLLSVVKRNRRTFG